MTPQDYYSMHVFTVVLPCQPLTGAIENAEKHQQQCSAQYIYRFCALWNSNYSDCLSLQSLTEKLNQKELDCVELDGKLRENKRTAQMDKEVLKKATKSAIVYQPLLP